MKSKLQLRQKMRHVRQTLATQGQEAATALVAAAQDLDVASKVVSGFWPIGTEIDPRPLMQALANRGATLALPTIEPPLISGEGDHVVVVGLMPPPNPPPALRVSPLKSGGNLLFRAFSFGDDLVEGPMKIMQPLGSAQEVSPDILLVPLLAFDGRGFRLGYGGGYYDRALAFLRAQKKVMAIGLAFAGQMVDQIPTEPHDAPLDAILTEEGLTIL